MTARLTDEQIEGMSRWAEEHDLPAFAKVCGPMAAAELRDHHTRIEAHAREACLDCSTQLAPCDCQPNCPGGKCPRKCWEGPAIRLLPEEREALRWAAEFLSTSMRLTAGQSASVTDTMSRATAVLARLTKEPT
jgi:hypothetical protein